MGIGGVGHGIVGAGLAGGAVAAAMLGMGAAHADDATDAINGWTVTPTPGSGSGLLLPPATLSDPSDSLGLGKSIAGSWDSVSAAPLSSVGANDQFVTSVSTLAKPDNLSISNVWGPGLDIANVQRGFGDNFSATGALLAPSLNGHEVVDLFQFSSPKDPIPLFNPAATGPIDVGGLPLADPKDGALVNDLFDAVFKGDSTAWTKATTLFDAWLGTDSSGSAASGGAAAATDTTGSTGSAALLATAVTDFSDAKTVLSGVEGSDDPSIGGQIGMLDNVLKTLNDAVGPVESTVLAHTGPLSTVIDQWYFDPLNQNWADAAKALLTADQGLAAADTSGLEGRTLSASLPVLNALWLDVIPAKLESAPLVFLGDLLGDGSGAADASAAPDFFGLPF